MQKKSHNKWEAYFDNGREPSGLDVIEWAKKVESLGAGEIMLTSIDAEGTKKGFDINLNKAVSEVVSIPVISSGGAGNEEHISNLLNNTSVDAVALASVLHYELLSIGSIKQKLVNNKIKVRM